MKVVVAIAGKKKVVQEPVEISRGKIYYAIADLYYSKYTCTFDGTWHIRKRYLPEWIRWVESLGYTAEESSYKFGGN